MMGIARPAAADQASLLGHIFYMLAIPDPARLGEQQGALVDRFRLTWLLGLASIWSEGADSGSRRTDIGVSGPLRIVGGEAEELGAKAFVDVFGVSCVEFFGLVGVTPLRPAGGLVTSDKIVEFDDHPIAQSRGK